MDVSLGEVSAPLQDLRVGTVALQQPLTHSESLKAVDGQLELAVGGIVLPAPVGDPAEPDVRLRDARALLQTLGKLEGLAGKVVRVLHLVLVHGQLAHAEQHVAAAELDVGLIADLQRPLEVVTGAGKVASCHQHQREVVFRTRERDPVPQELEQRHRSHRVARGGLHLAHLLVGHAETAVHPRDAAQVEERACGFDRLAVGLDGTVQRSVCEMGARQNAKQAGFRRRRDRIQAAADRERLFREGDGVFRLSHVREGGLGADAFGEHHAVVDRLEMSPRLGEQRRGLLRL